MLVRSYAYHSQTHKTCVPNPDSTLYPERNFHTFNPQILLPTLLPPMTKNIVDLEVEENDRDDGATWNLPSQRDYSKEWQQAINKSMDSKRVRLPSIKFF